ncbi:MAG: hypothetical protein ACSHX0_06060 [Akkermansiaceae bacterium]
MRAFRATFLLLLFITSFARCWADVSGLLDQSSLACCAPVEHLDHDHESEDSHDENSEDPVRNCATCDLVKSGFTVSSLDLEVPTSFFVIYLNQIWSNIFLHTNCLLSAKESLVLLPPVPPEMGTNLSSSRIVTTSAISVRGPNLV